MYIFLQISQTRSKGGGVCKMKDCVIISMAIGVIVGALVVSNSEKARQFVNKSKKALKEQVEKMK